ncbi:hypothetical protein B7O95_04630, partial [Streptococcus dysgalactiae subsp. equisimilis]
DLKRNLFKIDVRAQKDEEKVFMRTAWLVLSCPFLKVSYHAIIRRLDFFTWEISHDILRS